jgi:hypothetical protein
MYNQSFKKRGKLFVAFSQENMGKKHIENRPKTKNLDKKAKQKNIDKKEHRHCS